MNGLKKLELTFAIIKPDVAAVPHLVEELINQSLNLQGIYYKTKETNKITSSTFHPFMVLLPLLFRYPLFFLGTHLPPSNIRKTILSGGFYFIRSKKIVVNVNEAMKFYSEHRKKFFYKRLLSFICSGPSFAHILAREDAIEVWRNLMGPTNSYRSAFTHPNSLRGTYGLSDTRNATHGSDSPQSAAREIKIFFPYFSIPDWYETEEQKFRNGKCVFNEEEYIHEVVEKREKKFGSPTEFV